MIIAIDGPAGSGKSTVSKMLADSLGFIFLNTGSFYRAITFALLRHFSVSEHAQRSIDYSQSQELIDFAQTIALTYKDGHLFINDEQVDQFLRSDLVEQNVAQVSSIIEIRHIVNTILRSVTQDISIVCEGRDMTTVVFPHAEYKFFLDASVESRAKRRFAQGTSVLSFDEIVQSIAKRDDIDRNKTEGSLKIADDAIYLDTSDLTIQEVCDMIISKIHY